MEACVGPAVGSTSALPEEVLGTKTKTHFTAQKRMTFHPSSQQERNPSGDVLSDFLWGDKLPRTFTRACTCTQTRRNTTTSVNAKLKWGYTAIQSIESHKYIA
jgi:hypothetical protein